MYWELLKRFPGQEPFGSDWFRVFSVPGHPLAQLRIQWIMVNAQYDEDERSNRKKEELEFAGFLANPEVYFAYKKINKPVNAPFKIQQDYSDFDRRMKLALSGTPEIHDRREDIAEKVRIMRDKLDSNNPLNDPRIVKVLSDEDYLNDFPSDGDSLIIEKR